MSMENDRVQFEVCCGSVDDVVQAYRGGADRVELNSSMFLGGLTPSVGSLIEAKKRAPLPVMCMVRPREGGFCYTECEYAAMLNDARILIENGADGIVFGFLHEDGTVNIERCREMLEIIGDRTSVFHRAIDVVPDVFAALDVLIELGVNRVLTSGQKPRVPQGLAVIKKMISHAGGRIQILPGGGIDPGNAAWVRRELGVTQLHATAHRGVYDRSTLGNPAIHFGGALYPPEDRYLMADPEAVAAFCREIRG